MRSVSVFIGARGPGGCSVLSGLERCDGWRMARELTLSEK